MLSVLMNADNCSFLCRCHFMASSIVSGIQFRDWRLLMFVSCIPFFLKSSSTNDCEIQKHEGYGLNCCLHVLWLINTNILEEPATFIFYPEDNKQHVLLKCLLLIFLEDSIVYNHRCVNPKSHDWKNVFIMRDHKYYKRLFYFNNEIFNYRASGHGVIETVVRHTYMSYAASWFWK